MQHLYGEAIQYSSLLTAYHNKFLDHKIFYFNQWPGTQSLIGTTHPYITTYIPEIHNNVKMDIIYEISVPEFSQKYKFKMENCKCLYHLAYEYFKLKYNIDLPMVPNIPCVAITDKTIKKYDKPLCLLNHCVSYGRF